MNENPSKEGHKKSGIVQGPIAHSVECCVWGDLAFGLSVLCVAIWPLGLSLLCGGIWPFGLRTVTMTEFADALTDPIKITIAADSTQLFDNV